ncbi:MAG: glutamate--tRNA ligase [Candidatus Omnitrophota bacterium]
MVKVRFAPSPTGYLHIGGARTCLFNWLYARSQKGMFVLRIEDTDQARSKKEFLDEILESLKWLGLDWDELYFQSQRFDIYREYAQKLLAQGKAYLADDNSGAIFLKMPQEIIEVNDLIHGVIKFDPSLIKDQVLIKSDQSATYSFACVVDDALMGITHVIRGDDHISNTPKQLAMYEALGFQKPQFAHIPMILGKGGGRMSKRTGATAISEYRQMGFLADALVNYLMLLGWAPGNNQEIISLSEAVKKFDIVNSNKTAATFDMDKLTWLNGQYIRACDLQVLADLITPFLKMKQTIAPSGFSKDYLMKVLRLVRERGNTLEELASGMEPFFVEEIIFEDKAKKKLFSQDLSRELSFLKEKFQGVDNFQASVIEEVFRSAVEELGITVKQLIHPLRVALSGVTIGPGMFELIEVLGKERTLERIERVIVLFRG